MQNRVLWARHHAWLTLPVAAEIPCAVPRIATGKLSAAPRRQALQKGPLMQCSVTADSEHRYSQVLVKMFMPNHSSHRVMPL